MNKKTSTVPLYPFYLVSSLGLSFVRSLLAKPTLIKFTSGKLSLSRISTEALLFPQLTTTFCTRQLKSRPSNSSSGKPPLYLPDLRNHGTPRPYQSSSARHHTIDLSATITHFPRGNSPSCEDKIGKFRSRYVLGIQEDWA